MGGDVGEVVPSKHPADKPAAWKHSLSLYLDYVCMLRALFRVSWSCIYVRQSE